MSIAGGEKASVFEHGEKCPLPNLPENILRLVCVNSYKEKLENCDLPNKKAHQAENVGSAAEASNSLTGAVDQNIDVGEAGCAHHRPGISHQISGGEGNYFVATLEDAYEALLREK